MQYVCLVYHDMDVFLETYAGRMAELNRDSAAYDAELERQGLMVLAHALKPCAEAQVVRRRGGKTLRVDGPFAETKEELIGFIVVEAASLEQAIQIGAQIPLARSGTVVVRETFSPA
ncbi:YciI family protein [Salmonella enterica subsp. enterica]|nr:YciI family protein [Salmonella enterica subsp. enterica serovar Kottbus]EFG8200092.1 YciI family protein [Escherichia coli]MIL09451.1 YciI family protein [Salmonella enterica subsp. enterica serovar Enteritidis]